MPAPVMIANRPLLPRLLLLFWVAEIAVGLLFATAGYGLLGPSENGGAVVLMLMGLDAIEMTDTGLMDRRLSTHPIPWEAIAWKVIFNGRSYALQMDVAEPARSAAGIGWPARALGLFSRMLRQPEFNVATLGTGLSADDIGKRMAGFKHAKD